MQILITGAAGFVGQLLAKEILSNTTHNLLLVDVVEPLIPTGVANPDNARCLKADLCTDAAKILEPGLDAAFIFHGIMSSGSEANFELGMRVNVDATRAILDALRLKCPGTRVIYASSQAVYGQPLPEVVTEAITPTPESSYGCEKMICEMLVNEYTRRKFINGFILRFPTISVRPGKPTAAASSFLSGMIREPLAGIECVIPLEDREFRSWMCSPSTLTKNLMHTLQLEAGSLPPHVRAINMPGISVTIQEMLDALSSVGGKEKLSLIKEKTDREAEAILRSWPTRFDNSLAYSLGYRKDQSFESTVMEYKSSFA